MSTLITRLAYERIDRSRLLVAYGVGLAVGALIALAILLAIGVPQLPAIH
jgi:hypothetical protein